MYSNLRNASQLRTLISFGRLVHKTQSLNGSVYALQTRSESHESHESHGPFAGDQFKIKNKWGWKSWRDIPDEMIPTTSKRDPNNTIYGTRKYINLRKQQLWFQLDDGRPVWLKLGLPDQIWFYMLVGFTALNTIYVWYSFYLMWSGKPQLSWR